MGGGDLRQPLRTAVGVPRDVPPPRRRRRPLRRLLLETDGAKVVHALDEFGWTDLLDGEPAEAVAALFETQGETLSGSPALNAVLARPLLGAFPGTDDAGGVGEWTVAIPGPG